MRNRIKLTSFAFVLIFLASCNAENKITFERATSRSGYAIDVMSTMEPSTSLNEEASLQFFDEEYQLFVIVLDEDKQEMIDAFNENEDLLEFYSTDFNGYTDFLMDNFNYSMEVKREGTLKDTIINGMKSKTLGIVSELDNTDIYYNFAFIEGAEKYYQVWTWTYAQLEQDYQPLMDHILFSFEEL